MSLLVRAGLNCSEALDSASTCVPWFLLIASTEAPSPGGRFIRDFKLVFLMVYPAVADG